MDVSLHETHRSEEREGEGGGQRLPEPDLEIAKYSSRGLLVPVVHAGVWGVQCETLEEHFSLFGREKPGGLRPIWDQEV